MAIDTLHPATQNKEQDEIIEQLQEQKSLQNKQCFFFLGDTQTGKKLLNIFEGVYYSIFITVITVITLFADDFRIIFFTSNEDFGFSILNLVCMGFFFMEVAVLSFVKENYFLGFYFWLDMVSTATMILDLIWIKQLMSGNGGAVQSAASVAKVARASRASKIGAKATKLIRIIRLIRFLKLYKTASKQLAKQNSGFVVVQTPSKQNPASKKSKLSTGALDKKADRRWSRVKKDSSHQMIELKHHQDVSLMNLAMMQGVSTRQIILNGRSSNMHNPNQIDRIMESIKKIQHAAKKRHTQNLKDLAGFQGYFRELHTLGTKGEPSLVNIDQSSSQIQVPNQTRVGTKIKDQVQKNLIAMILLIIISVPLFNASTWYSNINSYQKGILQLENAAKISSNFYDALDAHYIDFMMNLPQTLVYYQIAVNATCCKFPDDYPMQTLKYSVTSSQSYRTDDLVTYVTDSGSIAIFESSGTATLTAQCNIGRTLFVCLVLIISTLLFSRDIEVYALEPLENMFETVSKIAMNPLGAIMEIEEKNMCIETMEEELAEEKMQLTEPNMLENLIVKIGGLLAVGFGEAGTEIISKVIQDPNFVNVIIPGEKVIGIYGFCDIRNFTDATEILQADVMVFVNQIAQICHSIVNGHCGSPNKNIGDAFLLVWKYKQGDTKFDDSEGQNKVLELVETKRVKQLADLAVLSFVRMIAEINKSFKLLKYKKNPALKNRIKDYKGVKMGFGLHVGWSIEGPIGSEFKVDASYLSPSVNMASRLEAGTKEYGVPMLITGQVYKLMTQNKHYLRQVDRVIFQGYKEPTDLYTVDLNIQNLNKKVGVEPETHQTSKQKKYQKIQQNIMRNKLLNDIETKFVTKQMWNEKDIQILRQGYSQYFYEEWNKGFKCYVKGDWEQSVKLFKKVKEMAPLKQDGPSDTLIEFMEGYGSKAPVDWKGYRDAVL